MTHGATPPGWYDDGRGAQRWWDGNGWTEHTQPTRPPQPDPHSEPTRYGGPTPDQHGQQPSAPSLDKGAGGSPPAPPPSSSDVTQVAPPNPAFPAQPGYQQAGPGVQPSWQQPYTPSGSGGRGKLVALVGGGAAVVIVVIVLAVVLLGGGGPRGTVEDFLNAAADGDCSVVEYASNATLGTDEDGRDDAVDQARRQCDDEGINVEEGASDGCDIDATDEEVDGDTATVDYEITGCDDDAANSEGSFDLVEEDGDWRIEGLLPPSP